MLNWEVARSLEARYVSSVTRKSLAEGVDLLLAAALRGELSETQARQLAQREPEAVTLALLALARRIAEPDFTPDRYRSRIRLIDRRLTELAQWQRQDDTPIYHDADTLRLAKRLRKHWDFLFTFLDKPQVPFDNNLAERAIRPAVILRKNSQSNRSEQGAATQAILMSIYRTLRLRGHDPTQTITAALRTYLQTGKLPPLPAQVVANG